MNLNDIILATDAAFAAASTSPKPVAPTTIGENTTLQTDIYDGPLGTGFCVTASLKIGDVVFTRCRNSGPETEREAEWNFPAIIKAALGGFWNSLSNEQKEAIADDYATVSALLQSGDVPTASLRCQKVYAAVGQTLTDEQKAKAEMAMSVMA